MVILDYRSVSSGLLRVAGRRLAQTGNIHVIIGQKKTISQKLMVFLPLLQQDT